MAVNTAVIFALLAVILTGADSQPHKTKQAQTAQQPASPVSASLKQQQQNGAQFQAEHKEQVQADVSIVKTPERDFFDKAALGVNIALAAVGLIGVGIGIWTLCYIRRQAVEMRQQRIVMRQTLGTIRKQADVMEGQLTEMKVASDLAREAADAARVNAKASTVAAFAAEKSADAALAQIRATKDRERARLSIRGVDFPEILPPEPIQGLRGIRVGLQVANDGFTKAFNIVVNAAVDIVKDRAGDAYEIGFQQAFPSTLANTENLTFLPKFFVSALGADHGSPMFTNDATAEALREGTRFLQVSGLLTFTDIFDDSHEVPFRYVWVSEGDDDGRHWRTRSKWYVFGVTAEEVEGDRQP